MPHHHLCALATGTIAMILASPAADAAGFQLAERSASGLGRAFSGEAAIADDPSVISSNPAAMVLLDDTAVSVGLSTIIPGVDVSGTADLSALGGPSAFPASDKGVVETKVVPYLYAAQRINDQFSVGFASFTMYGLATDYAPGAYITGQSDLTTINLNPSASVRLTDKLSLGLGVSAVYSEATLTGNLPASLGGSGRMLRLEGDDWGFGFNLGLLYEFSDSTRIGINYRSEVDLTLSGSGDNLFIPAVAGGPAVNVDAAADLTLPDSFEFSIYHEINDRWAVHGDVMWTGWSDFPSLTAEYGGQLPLLHNHENWKDTIRLSIGATCRYNDKLTLRCGFAFDESPVPDADHRTLRIPDGDRYWASIGASYQFNDCYRFDIGYTHIFTADTSIHEPGAGNGTFTGTATGDVNVISTGISASF
ncbi:MAG: OmpP1/FadL family transporter [Verrucomicrobiales bacterium]